MRSIQGRKERFIQGLEAGTACGKKSHTITGTSTSTTTSSNITSRIVTMTLIAGQTFGFIIPDQKHGGFREEESTRRNHSRRRSKSGRNI